MTHGADGICGGGCRDWSRAPHRHLVYGGGLQRWMLQVLLGNRAKLLEIGPTAAQAAAAVLEGVVRWKTKTEIVFSITSSFLISFFLESCLSPLSKVILSIRI